MPFSKKNLTETSANSSNNSSANAPLHQQKSSPAVNSPKKPLPPLTNSERKIGPTTRITIQYDVGFSNAIFLRGKGATLAWEKGIPLKNTKPNEWVWETNAPFTTCEFKVLINDKDYEIGDNHLLTCGASIHYTPKFH